MKDKLLNKIKELTADYPENWKQQAADKMGISRQSVTLIANGKIGNRGCDRQLELISVLKTLRQNLEDRINAAVS